MITAEMAEKEIVTGLSAVCAWCEHWHEAKRRGEVSACGKPCGGPASGMVFPMYRGPMSGRLGEMCFICGGEASAGLQWKGGFIGVCKKFEPGGKNHLDMFMELISAPSQKVVAKEITVPIVGDKV